MKTKLTFLLACLLFANLSCKKSGTTEEPVTPTPTKIKLLTKVTSTSGTNSSTTSYTYDDKKRLISLKSGTFEYIYSYNDRGELLKRVSGPFGSTSELEPVYEDGRIRYVWSRNYKNGALDNERKFGYVYSSGGNVIEVDQNFGNIREVTYKLDYVGDNCIKLTSDDPTFGYYAEYTYDEKKAPNYNSNARLLLGSISGPFPIHNILTAKTTYTYAANSPAPSQSSSTFTYDADGYPLTAKQGSSTVTYEYTEL